jgi:dihydroorotate dehydrogenase
LIGCGGIEDALTALAKIEAGATLLQIYTGLIYRGPGVIDEILAGLGGALVSRGVESIGALVGVNARDHAVEAG